MEASWWDVSRWTWSYRKQTGSSSHSTISSSSGTISSSNTSGGSRLSTISMEAAMHYDRTELERIRRVEKEEQIKKIKSLVHEFFGAAPAANCSIEGADVSVLERWFTELGVEWVLHLADAAPERNLEHTCEAWRWIRALDEIMDTIRLMRSLPPGSGSVDAQGGPATAERSEELGITEQLRFALFTQQAMLKMLSFVNVIAAPSTVTCEDFLRVLVPASIVKLEALFRVHQTLSIALSVIRPRSSDSSLNAEVERIHGEIASVSSAMKAKAGEAIWSTVMGIWTAILESIEDSEDSSGTKTLQVSSDIHKASRCLLKFLSFLEHNHRSFNQIVYEGLPQIGHLSSLGKLVPEMISCLQETLANNSEKFQDQSLRFLFLLNNSNFLKCSVNYFVQFCEAALTGKVKDYMESYLQVSWAPVLSCLFDPTTPLCFGKNYSPLSKFEYEFQKTYATQKLWKVPDPELRKTLREAIIEKIIPGYTEYIAENKVTNPKFTPQDLVEVLQELFEG